MSDAPERREPTDVGIDVPPCLVVDPRQQRHLFRVGEDGPVELDVELYNIGRATSEIIVYVVGDAVSNHYLHLAGELEAHCGAFFDPLEASLRLSRVEGAQVLEGHLFEFGRGGPKPKVYPAGLTLAPPFQFRKRSDARWARSWWADKVIELWIGLEAASAGWSSFDIFFVPVENRAGACSINVELDVVP